MIRNIYDFKTLKITFNFNVDKYIMIILSIILEVF